MPKEDTITAEQLYIDAFTSFMDGVSEDSKDAQEAKRIVEYFREATGEKNDAIDAMLFAFVAGFSKGFEVAEYLYNPKPQK